MPMAKRILIGASLNPNATIMRKKGEEGNLDSRVIENAGGSKEQDHRNDKQMFNAPTADNTYRFTDEAAGQGETRDREGNR